MWKDKREPVHATHEEEEEGECVMLIKHDHIELTMCGQGTHGNWANYCSECWNGLSEQENSVKARVFPPTSDDKANRWVKLQDSGSFRLLNETELSRYGKLAYAIHLRVEPDENWKDEKYHLYTVYLIRCGDGSLYVGQTRGDYNDRINEHRTGVPGKSAKWIRDHKGVEEVINTLGVVNRIAALEVEKAIYLMFRSAGIRISMGTSNDD